MMMNELLYNIICLLTLFAKSILNLISYKLEKVRKKIAKQNHNKQLKCFNLDEVDVLAFEC